MANSMGCGSREIFSDAALYREISCSKSRSVNCKSKCNLCKGLLVGKFSLPTLEEYFDLICKCFRLIPEHVMVHRLTGTGDGDKKLLIAPEWCGDKARSSDASGCRRSIVFQYRIMGAENGITEDQHAGCIRSAGKYDGFSRG